MNLSWNNSSTEDLKSYDTNSVFHTGMENFQIANTAYPINHNQTIKPYRVANEDLQSHIGKVWQDVDELLLYAHVPFCSKICSFCELSVVKPKYIKDDTTPYFDALNKEINLYADSFEARKKVLGFDIWGWTPSIVDTKYIWEVIDTVDRRFDLADNMRMSIETTPKIAAEELQKMRDYYNMWIRRISMWIQSLSGKLIWRVDASAEDNIRATENIREAWFEQFNVDVMYGFANQWNDDVARTIEHIIWIDPEFVTLYPMRYKGTAVEGRSKHVQSSILTEQYTIAYDMLTDAGYKIRPWKNTCSKIEGNDWLSDYLHHRVLHGMPYLWFWLWAQSFNPSNNLSYNQWAHIKHNAEYIKQVNMWLFPIQDAHHLSREAAIWKMIAISFFYWWIHLESFKKIFWKSLQEIFPNECKYIQENDLMEYIQEDGILQLTKKWVANYSWVISLFYSPATKKYLLDIDNDNWMWKSASVRDIKTKAA